MIDAAATLTLLVNTDKAKAQLEAFGTQVQQEHTRLRNLLNGNDLRSDNLLRHIASVKQDIKSIAREVALTNQQLTDMADKGGKSFGRMASQAVEAANATKEVKAGFDAVGASASTASVKIGESGKVMTSNLLGAAKAAQEVRTGYDTLIAAATSAKVLIGESGKVMTSSLMGATKAVQEAKTGYDTLVASSASATAQIGELGKTLSSSMLGGAKAVNEVKTGYDTLIASATSANTAIKATGLLTMSSLLGSVKDVNAQLAELHQKLGGIKDKYKTAGFADYTKFDSSSSSLVQGMLGAAVGGAAGNSVKKHTDDLKVLHDTARGAAAGVGYLWMTWGNIGAMAAGFAGVRGATAALKDMAEIEVNLVKASNESGMAFDQLNSRMMALYKDGMLPMMTGPAEVSQALKDLIYAGFGAEEALKTLPTVLKFAEVGEISMSDAAKVLQQTLNSFKGTTAAQAADVLAKAAAASATDIGEMTHAMNQAVSIGALYNVSIEDTAVALAVLAKSGIKGGEAGTALRQFMSEMAAPKTEKAREAFKALRLEMFKVGEDGVRRLKDLPGIIDELRSKLKGYSEVDQKFYLDAISTITNERGVKFLSQAIQTAQKDLDQLNEDVKKNSLNYVDNVYKKLADTNRGLWKQVVAELKATGQESVRELDQALKDLGKTMINLVKSDEFKMFLDGLVTTFKTLVTVVNEHGKEILVLASVYAGLKLATGAVDMLGVAWGGLKKTLRDTHTAFTDFDGLVAQHEKKLGTEKLGLGGKITMVGGLFARWIPIVGVSYGLIQGLLAMMGGAVETTTERITRRIKELKQLSRDMDPTSELKEAEKLLNMMEETERARRGGTMTRAMKEQMDAQRAYIKLLKDSLDARGLLRKQEEAAPVTSKDKTSSAAFLGNSLASLGTPEGMKVSPITRLLNQYDKAADTYDAVLDAEGNLTESGKKLVQLHHDLTPVIKDATKAEKERAAVIVQSFLASAERERKEDKLKSDRKEDKKDTAEIIKLKELEAESVRILNANSVRAANDETKHKQRMLDMQVQAGILTQEQANLTTELAVAKEREAAITTLQNEVNDLSVEWMNAEIAGNKTLASEIRNKALAREGDIQALEREAKQLEEVNKLKGVIAAKKAADEAKEVWKKASDEIERTLTDALMRGFEGGKTWAENFRDTLKNLFNTLILRPIIQPIAQYGAQTLMGMVGMGGATAAQAAGGGDPLSLLSSASSLSGAAGVLSNTASGLMSGATSIGSILGASTANVAAAASYGTAIGSAQTAALVAQEAGMAASAGVSGALSAIPVWGWAAMAGMALFGDKIFGGETKQTGSGVNLSLVNGRSVNGYGFADYEQEGGWFGSDSNWREAYGIDTNTATAAISQVADLLGQIGGREALDRLKTFTATYEGAQEGVDAWLKTAVDGMASLTLGGAWVRFKREGEDAAVALERLVVLLGTVGSMKASIEDNILNLSGGISDFEVSARAASRELTGLFVILANTTDAQTRIELEGQIHTAVMARYQAEKQFLTEMQTTVKELTSNVVNARNSVAGSIQEINPLAVPTAAQLREAIAAVSGPQLPSLDAVLAAGDRASWAQQAATLNETITSATARITSAQAALVPLQAQYAAALQPFFTQLETYSTSSGFGFAGSGNSLPAAYTPEWYDFRNKITSVTAAAEPYQQEWSAAKQVLTPAQAAMNAGNAAYGPAMTIADAQAALAAAQQAYSDSLTNYAGDAQTAIDALESLRSETMRYYQAQDALATLMSESASRLRDAVTETRATMSSASATSSLATRFDQAYSLALVTSGEALAGYADTLADLLPEYVSGLAGESATRADWQIKAAKALAQSEAIAARLDAAAPINYESESLSLLAAIDTGLLALSAGLESIDQQILAAIQQSQTATVDVLTQIRDLLGYELPGHADGLASVPYDNYTARLHKNEAVIDATTMSGLRKYGIPVVGREPVESKDNAALLAELRALREEVAMLRAEARATASNTGKTARMLDRAMPDGDALATRVAA